jgi:hypothetical protein
MKLGGGALTAQFHCLNLWKKKHKENPVSMKSRQTRSSSSHKNDYNRAMKYTFIDKVYYTYESSSQQHSTNSYKNGNIVHEDGYTTNKLIRVLVHILIFCFFSGINNFNLRHIARGLENDGGSS